MSTTTTVTTTCDKCGKELHPNNFPSLKHYSKIKAGKLKLFFPGWSCQEYDLCYDCNNKLLDWFSKKES